MMNELRLMRDKRKTKERWDDHVYKHVRKFEIQNWKDRSGMESYK